MKIWVFKFLEYCIVHVEKNLKQIFSHFSITVMQLQLELIQVFVLWKEVIPPFIPKPGCDGVAQWSMR